MRVAIHQPDLLPWSGFWFKMAHSDRFVLAVHDQLQKHWVQRRVMMRDSWVTLPLVGKPRLVPINTVEVKEGWQEHLVASMEGRYRGSRHWGTRGAELVDLVRSVDAHDLAGINIALIRGVQGMLGLETELVVTEPPREAGLLRVLEQLEAVGATSYLSGTGARGYIDADGERLFAERGIELVWSDHEPTTGDSVVSVLLDHDDPMAVVLRRHGDPAPA